MKVKAKRITPATFAAYGKVVTSATGEPTSRAHDYKFWSNIANYLIRGETEIGICTVYQQLTMEISGVERHMKTPEILIPIDAPFILPLLLEGQQEHDLQAFLVGIGEAVVIEEGVWHGACLPVGKNESSYFVIFRKNTADEDVAKKVIEKVQIAP